MANNRISSISPTSWADLIEHDALTPKAVKRIVPVKLESEAPTKYGRPACGCLIHSGRKNQRRRISDESSDI